MTVDIADGSLDDTDNSSEVTFTFSEAPVGFDASDITFDNGAVSNLQATGNPMVYTATFTADDGFEGQGSVSVGTDWTDAAGNAGGTGSDNVTIDTLNPTVTVTISDTSLNDGDSVSDVTFIFSEVPASFNASDITAVGGAISALTQDLGLDPSGKTIRRPSRPITGSRATAR